MAPPLKSRHGSYYWDSTARRWVSVSPQDAQYVGATSLDEFTTPESHTEETCAKCHDAPTNEPWSVFCAECTKLGLFG